MTAVKRRYRVWPNQRPCDQRRKEWGSLPLHEQGLPLPELLHTDGNRLIVLTAR